MKIVGIDVDGVLADFNAGYRKKFIALTKKDLFNGETEPPCWSYEKVYGYTEQEITNVWHSIRDDNYFWEGLDRYVDAEPFLSVISYPEYRRLNPMEVYFITSRQGVDVKAQTERWLAANGYSWEDPTVLIARGDKGGIAGGLGLTHFLDDRPENCLSVLDALPSCDVRLRTQRYNVEHPFSHRAQSLKQFWTRISIRD